MIDCEDCIYFGSVCGYTHGLLMISGEAYDNDIVTRHKQEAIELWNRRIM